MRKQLLKNILSIQHSGVMHYCLRTNNLKKPINYNDSRAFNKLDKLYGSSERGSIGRSDSVFLSNTTVPPLNNEPHGGGSMLQCDDKRQYLI